MNYATNHQNVSSNRETTDEEIRKLVSARLKVLSPDTMISFGSEGSFSVEQLTEELEKGSEIGKKLEDIQMEWLRTFKTGILI